MSNELKKVPKILRKKLKKQTFLNLNHIQVSSNEKLVELDKICNNITGTKFIIIYMKDNIIVGENIISISYPIYKHYLDVNLDARINAERSINKLAKQMKLLKANSYYIIHISNIENNSISKQNIDTTSFFANNLKGIRGHLIINANSYYWIDVKDNNIVVSKKKYIKPSINMMKNKMNNKGIYGIKAKNRKSILKYIHFKESNKNNSLIIITNLDKIIEIAFKLSNEILLKKDNDIKEYFKNYSTNKYKIFLVSNDKKAFINTKLPIINKILYQEFNGYLYINKK